VTCCAATRRELAHRCQLARCARRLALRANVLEKASPAFGRRPRTRSSRCSIAISTRWCRRRGSVGASGDLAPAHLALVLIARARRSSHGRQVDGVGHFRAEALKRAGSSRSAWTQGRSGAHQRDAGLDGDACAGVTAAEQLVRAADIAAALSIDALRGSFILRSARPRGAAFRGQVASAANIERLMRGSAINKSHECAAASRCYSFAAPPVHGAPRGAAVRRETIEIEITVHRQPDGLAESGDIGFVRQLSWGAHRDRPTCSQPLSSRWPRSASGGPIDCRSGAQWPARLLTRAGGVRSGLMMAQVTAAAVASSSRRSPTRPALTRSPPRRTKRPRQHEHGCGTQGGTRARRAPRSSGRDSVGCQASTARTLATSPALGRVHQLVRSRVPTSTNPAPSRIFLAITELIRTNMLENGAGS